MGHSKLGVGLRHMILGGALSGKRVRRLQVRRTRHARRLSASAPLAPVASLADVVGKILISPWVIMVDLFRSSRRVSTRWLVYLIMLSLLLAATCWGIARYSNYCYQHTFDAFDHYTQTMLDKKAIGNVAHADLINRYSLANGLDPALVAAVVACESSFNPSAVSSAGARGLMQIIPSTWRDLNPAADCKGDHQPPSEGPGCIFDPESNIQSGTRYLKELLAEFNGDVVSALAAYNAGRGAVRYYAVTTGGLPPYSETQRYVQNVAVRWSNFHPGIRLSGWERAEQLQVWQNRLSKVSVLLWLLAAIWLSCKWLRPARWFSA